MLIVSHCHLDFPDFADDLGTVVERAAAASSVPGAIPSGADTSQQTFLTLPH